MISIPDSLQEVFDKVAVHLLTQKQKSILAFGCAYRGEDGRKCAAGVLIPDDQYTPQMEGKGWTSLTKEVVDNKYSKEIQELQNIHDIRYSFEWQFYLKDFAERHNLTFPIIP